MSDVRNQTFSDCKTFFHQTVPNLPKNATEKVRFLKTAKNWVFWEKDGFFFEKNVEKNFQIR